MKILVVDDIHMARINMRRALEKEGIVVVEAESGHEAIKLFKEEKPDAVALDIDLPDLDGLEVLKELKNIDENVQVVMVTGMSSQYNLVETLKKGAKHFLVKPIDLMNFVKVMKEVAEK